MRDKRRLERGILRMLPAVDVTGLLKPFLYLMLLAVFFSGCTKYENLIDSGQDPLAAAGLDNVIPLHQTEDVAVDPIVSVAFKAGTDPAIVAASELTLKKGNSTVNVKKTVTGTTVNFIPESELASNTEYTATIKTSEIIGSTKQGGMEYTWSFKTGKHHRNPVVVSVVPLNNAKAVPLNSLITVTFDQELTTSMINLIKVVLLKGTTPVNGSLSFSGKTATFKPTANLVANSVYKGIVKTGSGSNDNDDDDEDEEDEDDEDDDKGDYDDYNSSKEFTWSFSTGGEVGNDVTAPVVSSVLPANNSTSVLTSSKVNVTFSEPMDPATITGTTITLKQGTVAIAGTVTYSGSVASFSPSAPLVSNTVYTGLVTTGVKDPAGNALATNFSWSFTTASGTDVTAPTVLSVIPLNNAVSVATNSKVTATFSEAMNAATITGTTFTLKQGTTAVPGTVTYSGTTATFTPTAALAGNTVYTATITTGVKDAAGNALATSYSWSFTTIAAVVGLSFANDVVPVLGMCNNCHTHNWTTSTVASTFYTNLVSGGYVNPTSPTTGKIYTKLNSGHPGGTSISAADINKVKTWITQGSKNN